MRPELLITCAALLVLVACKKDKEDEPQPQPPPVPQTGIVDIDGNYYDNCGSHLVHGEPSSNPVQQRGYDPVRYKQCKLEQLQPAEYSVG